MSSDGGKRKRQEDDEEFEGVNFSNNDINKKKRKVQNKIRCQRYRDKKKTNRIINSQISKHQTTSVEEEEKIKRRKEQDKQKSQRYRDKKRGSNLINLQTNKSSKTFVNRVPKQHNFHNSQIAGPSTRNVPYVPPIDAAGLSTHNESYIPESHSDSDDDIHDDIPVQVSPNNTQNMDSQHSLPAPTYSSIYQNSSAHLQFQKSFFENDFGHSCDICDRLWFKEDLKIFVNNDTTLNIKFLRTMLKNVNVTEVKICSTCLTTINKNRVPPLSVHNGFKYPPFPQNLKNFQLDLVTERLISPRIPFMQIRRLRHVHGQFGIYGQVINVPIEVNTMVNSLPRNIDDDHSITVHIKRKKIHKSNYLCGIVNKRKIKAWLQHLKDSPLYTSYGITVDDSFLNGQDDVQDEIIYDEDGDNDISEQIPIDESLVAQQQTLMWNDEMYLRIAPGEGNVPVSLLFDEHAEELSFPQIYLGQFRTFRDGVNVTPFMMATSELRRSDRRGVTPQHLLYMAMKIMRIRLRDSLSIAFKHVGKGTTITKEQIESEDYIQGCTESNLAFLRTIPNSAYYWLQRKKDLFAMIRQYGKPTVFFTISANEIGWPKLLQLLHNSKYNSEISLEDTAELHYIEKSTLINEDAVTCAIYFNKLVNVLMKILQSKRYSPFKKYRILHYFKRIEFQHRGSPHAHILAWLDNAPEDALGKDYNKAIDLIDFLISVSAAEASGNIKLQTHKHTFTCYKGIASKSMQKCRFEAPFMPIKTTMILTPMKDTEDGFKEYKTKYIALRKKLENYEYDDFQTFYEDNNINSDQEYVNVIRAGINRPKVFPKRQPHEKWHNPFNPFIMNIVQSNTDFQFITEEYSCAAYVVEYINKTNRGVSNLQRKIIEVMDEHPEFDIFDITKNISINLLNHTEITSQEAAWYLLREPMSKSSTIIVYIPTIWPIERQRIKKTMKELSELDDDCTDIWKENWFDKYEKRPEDLENISLAQFVSKYYKNNKGEYVIRDEPRVIRYRSYDMATDLNEYKREMVTLHIPFRHEESEILGQMKFIKIYDENVDLILQKRKEFESNIDIEKTLQICRELCREEVADDGEEIRDVVGRLSDQNPFQELYDNPSAKINDDLLLAMLNKLGAIAKKKENIMSYDDFYDLMRRANEEQREIMFHTMHHLISTDEPMREPLLVYLTGPAGSGKTFVIKGIMEIYNRFSDTDGIFNAYIACASTGKAATAIGGSTVHSALSISLSRLMPLNIEKANQYRTLFKFVKVLIIDEISMVSAELLEQINARLKQITGLFTKDFGGLDVILIGDLRQLPPVKATPIFKQIKKKITGETPWRKFKKFELTQVMRQEDRQFAEILTKIGDGNILTKKELEVMESRFITKEEAQSVCPEGIRLIFTNVAVNEYNYSVLKCEENKIISVASDVIVGCHNTEQENFVRQKLHKMKTDDTGGLPYELILVLNRPYMITNNIDVADGLSNGTVGKLYHVERDENGDIIRIWMKFPKSCGRKRATKLRNISARLNLDDDAVPITSQTSSIALNNNKTIIAKRKHFPLVSALAMTIHKSQGGTYDAIVYEYSRKHPRELVYVALTRVTRIQGLFMVTQEDTEDSWKFWIGRIGIPLNASESDKHLKRSTSHREDLTLELKRLQNNTLQTVSQTFLEFISNKNGLSIFSFNCQSLHAHAADLKNDAIVKKSNILLLSETRMKNEEPIHIPDFNFVASYKRPEVTAAGVAIYSHTQNTSHIVTSYMNIHTKFTRGITVDVSDIGEICVARCNSENGQYILIAAVYISPGKSISQIKQFLFKNLMIYTKEGSEILEKRFGEKFDDIPMILSGDFNINFADDKNLSLIEFLDEALGLTMSNDRKISTTKYKTTIDAVFTRYLDKFQSKIFVSYFSYHKPIVSLLEYNEMIESTNNLSIVEINDENDKNNVKI